MSWSGADEADSVEARPAHPARPAYTLNTPRLVCPRLVQPAYTMLSLPVSYPSCLQTSFIPHRFPAFILPSFLVPYPCHTLFIVRTTYPYPVYLIHSILDVFLPCPNFLHSVYLSVSLSYIPLAFPPCLHVYYLFHSVLFASLDCSSTFLMWLLQISFQAFPLDQFQHQHNRPPIFISFSTDQFSSSMPTYHIFLLLVVVWCK